MNQTILIVDDEPEIVSILSILFQAFGYATCSAANGHEAIARAREVLPDLVILDVMMPKMTGYEACHALKSDEATAHIAVLMLAAHVDRERAEAAGADAWMTKPFSNKPLLDCARRLLGPRG